MSTYIGRFAPSPTGLLHAGSLVAALASWLDARAHRGEWRVRIEDTDTPRCVPGAGEAILGQLARCGLHPDGEVWWQSRRGAAYAQALQQLTDAGLAYPCGCSRQDIQLALVAQGALPPRHGERVYPGTCRDGLHGKPARAWRLRCDRPVDATADGLLHWQDRRLGDQQQQLCAEVGDFVLRRADEVWAYQLAVVVDDAAQQITDVVRGEDLADNTPRQIHLQHALQLPTPRYLHTPLIFAADGQKLSKQTGAQALLLDSPEEVRRALRAAADALALPVLPADAASPQATTADWLAQAVAAWSTRWA